MSRFLVLFLFLLVLTGGTRAQAAFRIRSVRVAGTTYVLLQDVAAFYGLRMTSVDDDSRLYSRTADLRFGVNSREAVINGVKVSLSHAGARWQRKALLSETDLRLLVDPVLRGGALARGTVRRVVLDPGHGGSDPGAEGRRGHEKELTLAVATATAALLKRCGYDVRMTRNGDQRVGLRDRVAMARNVRADLFISIHINSAETSAASGAETFLLTPEGTRSTYSQTPKKRPTTGNTFDRENGRLAYELQRHLVHATAAGDRGLKHADFAVLRDAPCAAALVEIGFISNAAEEQRLRKRAYQYKAALGIARGIVAYHRTISAR